MTRGPTLGTITNHLFTELLVKWNTEHSSKKADDLRHISSFPGQTTNTPSCRLDIPLHDNSDFLETYKIGNTWEKQTNNRRTKQNCYSLLLTEFRHVKPTCLSISQHDRSNSMVCLWVGHSSTLPSMTDPTPWLSLSGTLPSLPSMTDLNSWLSLSETLSNPSQHDRSNSMVCLWVGHSSNLPSMRDPTPWLSLSGTLSNLPSMTDLNSWLVCQWDTLQPLPAWQIQLHGLSLSGHSSTLPSMTDLTPRFVSVWDTPQPYPAWQI